jgi:sigma-B regulation protein RsbU (phosphoserine phosphatase)
LQITIQMAVFKDSLEKKLKEAERREHELWLARRIQERFLPAVPQLDGVDIGIVSHPATEASGDYVDLVCMGENHLGLVIGDVSGHGMAAAMLMAQSRAYLRAVMQCFTEPGKRLSDQVGPTLAILNKHFRNDAPDDFFLTLAYARFNRLTRVLEFVGAGHPAGYVLDAAGQVKAQLDSLSLPLGVCEMTAFPAIPEVTLAAGDVLVLFTDGLFEARCPQGHVFGKARILQVVQDASTDSAQQIAESLYRAVRAYSEHAPPSDDISALILKVVHPGNPER